MILLLTQMDAGHAGVSGVFSQLREIALEQAFLLRATCVVAEMPTPVCPITTGKPLPVLFTLVLIICMRVGRANISKYMLVRPCAVSLSMDFEMRLHTQHPERKQTLLMQLYRD